MRYDYQCPKCDHRYNDVYFRLKDHRDKVLDWCPKHGHETFVQVIDKAPASEDWGNGGSGRYFEHLSHKGETFYDKASYKRYLREKGFVEWSPKRGMPGCDV